MPIISTFFGIIVRMFHTDHPPPHIHVQYGEFEAIIEIGSGRMLYGYLPKRARRLVEEWRRSRKRELLRAWNAAMAQRQIKRIKPLE